MAQEIARYSRGLTGDPFGFALVDDRIYLSRYSSGWDALLKCVTLRSRQSCKALSTSNSMLAFDAVTPEGMTFLVNCVAVKACAKAEKDPQLYIAEREASRTRLIESALLQCAQCSS